MSASETTERLSTAKQRLLEGLRTAGEATSPERESGPIALRPGTAPPALVLIHPVGGALFSYAPLIAALRTPAAVYGFANEAVPEAEPPADRIPRLASEYLSLLREASIPRPWIVGGWSFGGVVAYELARQDGRGSHLFLLDAAYVPEEESAPRPDSEIRRWFTREVAFLAGIPPERIDACSSDEVETYLSHTAAAIGLEEDEVRKRYRVFLANSHALVAYRPQPYEGAMTLVLAEESPDVTDAWARFLSGPIERHVVPGDHAGLVSAASAERIAPLVDDVLRRAGAR